MNLDKRIEQVFRVAEQAAGIKGIGITPSFVIAQKQLIRDVLEYMEPRFRDVKTEEEWWKKIKELGLSPNTDWTTRKEKKS